MWRTYIVGARPSLQPICQVTRANNQIRTATETYTVSGSPISTSTPRNSQKLESHCYSVPHFTHRRRKVGLEVCVMVEMMHWQLSPSARTTNGPRLTRNVGRKLALTSVLHRPPPHRSSPPRAGLAASDSSAWSREQICQSNKAKNGQK